MDQKLLEGLILEGLSQHKIANRLGCSQTTVAYWLKKYQLTTQRRRPSRQLQYVCRKHEGVSPKITSSGKRLCPNCVVERAAARRRRQWEVAGSIKKRQCVNCGFDEIPGAIHYHHESKKKFSVAESNRYGRAKLVEEINKCIPLCANCHRRKHYVLEPSEAASACDKHIVNQYNCTDCQPRKLRWHRQRTKATLVELLGGCCRVCLQKMPLYIYDFHHLSPEIKTEAVANLIASSKYRAIAKEVVHCILVCANCHSSIENKQYEASQPFLSLEEEEIYSALTSHQKWNKETAAQKQKCLCGKAKNRQSKACRDCADRGRRMIEWPEPEVLLRKLENTSFVKLGQEYGATDNAVRKYLKANGYEVPRKHSKKIN
jgi:cytochrome c553